MTEISSLSSLRNSSYQSTTKRTQQYSTQSYQQKNDTIESSAKQKESPKKGFKKYLYAGLAILGTGLAIAFGLKHLNAKKIKELEEKARQEAEQLRQQAEEARRVAEEKAAEEARKAQERAAEEARKAQEQAAEEARKAQERAAEEAKKAQEQAAEETGKAHEPKETSQDTQETEIIDESIKTEPENPVSQHSPETANETMAEGTPEVKTPEPDIETVKGKEEITANPVEHITEEPAPETGIKQETTEIKTEPEVKEKATTQETNAEEIKTETPKIRPPRPQGLSKAINTALDFGEDLTDLVEGKNATPEEIQKLIQKHFKNDNIHIHGMSEYDGRGVNAKRKAATTRPLFNENGKLETIDIFVPDLDYNNPNAVLEFISKTTHEMTHIAQFIEKDGTNAEYLKPTMEGRCLNYIQKIITDRYTDKLPTDMLKELFTEHNFIPKTAEDVNKFFDQANPELTIEKIGEVTKLGTDEYSRKQNVNIIFDVLFDPIMQQMAPTDINVQSLMRKYGGYNGFKAEMKRICAETFRNEEEAYKAEEMIRQELNGTVGQDTNYGIIHKIMGICADALG